MLQAKLATLSLVTILMACKWDTPLDDPAALQGEWEIVSVVREGTSDPGPVGNSVRFADNKVHFEATAGDMKFPTLSYVQEIRVPS